MLAEKIMCIRVICNGVSSAKEQHAMSQSGMMPCSYFVGAVHPIILTSVDVTGHEPARDAALPGMCRHILVP